MYRLVSLTPLFLGRNLALNLHLSKTTAQDWLDACWKQLIYFHFTLSLGLNSKWEQSMAWSVAAYRKNKLCFSIKLDIQSTLLNAETKCEIPWQAQVFFPVQLSFNTKRLILHIMGLLILSIKYNSFPRSFIALARQHRLALLVDLLIQTRIAHF